MEQSKYFKVKLNITIIAMLGIFTLPMLFSSYRQNAFNTIPGDPYEYYLLHLDNNPSGFLPGSPFTYRVFSIFPAFIIYKTLPFAPEFSNLEASDPLVLKAYFSISIANYIATVVLAWLVFKLILFEQKFSVWASIVAACSVLLLMQFTANYLLDPVVILYLFSCFFFYKRRILWSILLLLGIGVNEKIPLVFAMFTLATLMHQRTADDWFRFALSFLACLLYLIIRVAIFPMVGYENQIDLGSYWSGFINTFQLTVSFKGFYQVIIPISIVFLLAYPLLLNRMKGGVSLPYPLHKSHVGLILGMTFVAYVTNVEYNVGRNVMHLFPIFLPSFFIYLNYRFMKHPIQP